LTLAWFLTQGCHPKSPEILVGLKKTAPFCLENFSFPDCLLQTSHFFHHLLLKNLQNKQKRAGPDLWEVEALRLTKKTNETISGGFRIHVMDSFHGSRSFHILLFRFAISMSQAHPPWNTTFSDIICLSKIPFETVKKNIVNLSHPTLEG
jgi:hypothetical protein